MFTIYNAVCLTTCSALFSTCNGFFSPAIRSSPSFVLRFSHTCDAVMSTTCNLVFLHL